MQTHTALRELETTPTERAPRPRTPWRTGLAASTLSFAALIAASELTFDQPRVQPSSSPTTVVVRTDGGPASAAGAATPPLENDLVLCALGAEGIEATYPGPLVAGMVLRYSASCPQSDGGDGHVASD